MHRIALTALLAAAALPAMAQDKDAADAKKAPPPLYMPAPSARPAAGPPAGPQAPKPQAEAATAKGAPVNGVLVIYGNERCPTDKDGNEIVVCERRSAQEQFRVPKELREFKVTPENQSWARQAEGTLDAGSVGIGSCSAVGPGGGIGCTQQRFGAAKAFNQERKKAEQADK